LNDSLKLGGCAAIPGTLERLQCYDGLAAANGVAPSSTSANGDSGKWDVTESVNPVDDTKTVILSVTAGNVKSQYSKDIDLILRCKSGQTEVYVSWNSFLGSGQIETIMRLDSKPAEHSSWSLSSDNEAAFYPGNTVKFIKSLMKTSEVVAQVTPYDASPVTAIFDTTGLSSIIKPLSEACKWRLN
jgi:type VI secretion system protein VasI